MLGSAKIINSMTMIELNTILEGAMKRMFSVKHFMIFTIMLCVAMITSEQIRAESRACHACRYQAYSHDVQTGHVSK